MRGPLEVVEAIKKELAHRGIDATIRSYRRCVRGAIALIWDVFRSTSSVTYVRFNWALGVPLALGAVWQRVRGRFVIVHVPTPIRATLRQTSRETGRAVLVLKRLLGTVPYRAAVSASCLVIQNGRDDWRDSARVARKTLLLPNPSTARTTVPHQGSRRKSGDRFEIVGVATTDQYHRYDRFLAGFDGIDTALAVDGQVRITLVGPRQAFVRERRFVDALLLKSVEVVFTGELMGADLDEQVSRASIGLGTLGSGTGQGLIAASPLKHRLFMRHGVPLVTDTTELAAPQDGAIWIYRVPATGEPIDINEVLAWRLGLDLDRARREMDTALQEAHVATYVDRILERLPSASQRSD